MSNNFFKLENIKEKFKETSSTLTDALNEQVWFQELKGKWEDLDPQSKTNLKLASIGIGLLSIFLLILTTIWNVHSLKQELAEKRNLLNVIQTANDEIRRLRDTVPSLEAEGGSGAGSEKNSGPWSSYFESTAGGAGFEKASLSVSPEKPGTASEQSKEMLYELNLKHVNIKQIVRYAFSLENGQRPVKLRNLLIDTKGDPSGYLDATLSVSAFSMVKHE